MIALKKLGRNIDPIRPFIKRYGGIFSDLTLGTRFMWGDEFNIEYAVINDTLIMRETFSKHASFYYPLGKDVEGGIAAIEEYCKQTGEGTVTFGCLTDEQAAELSKRYAGAEIKNYRDWCDYIYPAEQFLTYAGKKLSGQRNHVNKFKRLYKDYHVRLITENDIPAVKDFLREYEKENDITGFAAEEEPRVYDLLDNMKSLDQFGIFVTVGEKIVSVSVGEIVGETLFVQVEKGLKEYEGVYPFTAQEFAKTFATDGVTKINREEDCGDLGLRVSKTQYHPSEIKPKNYVVARSAFMLIAPPVFFETDRLTVTDILREDKAIYAKLYTDDKINEFYGYDYRQDLGKNKPDGDYFFKFMLTLKAKKEEYSLAVRLDGKMIGEIVFYNFDYSGSAEIGFRFFTEYQGKGYALESVKAAIDYAFRQGFNKITCRHFKENARSEKLILKLGFSFTREDETHKFYELKK
ncbi:MAG: GNAT family N-acetyltransferase [Clostridia bacterium]|nr:GNAT family N-acetyltransferase [Clostridia bacterium]